MVGTFYVLYEPKANDMLIFERLQELCEYIEPEDVEDGNYRAWDSGGTELALTTGPRGVVNAKPSHASIEELRLAVASFLAALHRARGISVSDAEDSSAELPELLQQLLRSVQPGS